MQATATVGNLSINAGSITAEAAGGLLATAGAGATITAATVAGVGDGCAGRNVTTGTALALNPGTVSSTGALTNANDITCRADAVLPTATNGTITATIGTASAKGANADAINLTSSGANGIALNVTGAATTSGASGRAIFLQSVDGDIAITAARATTTGGFDTTIGNSSDVVTGLANGTGAVTINAGTTSSAGLYGGAIFGIGGGAVNIPSGRLGMGALSVVPFARFSHVHLVSDAVTENGGTATLAVQHDERNYKFGSLGLRVDGNAPIGAGATFLPRFSAAYTRGWDIRGTRTASFLGTTPAFTVTGAALGRDSFDVHAGFDVAFGQRLTLGVGGFGSTSREWSDYGAKASIGLRF